MNLTFSSVDKNDGICGLIKMVKLAAQMHNVFTEIL